MQPLVKQESLMVPVTGKVQLHLRRLWMGDKGAGQPVLMFHGAAEDGHIFYSHTGMLTHPEAEQDHFPQLLDWMRE